MAGKTKQDMILDLLTENRIDTKKIMEIIPSLATKSELYKAIKDIKSDRRSFVRTYLPWGVTALISIAAFAKSFFIK